MPSKAQDASIVILLIAALAVLVAFQLWIVAAAVLLMLAGIITYASIEYERTTKLETRMAFAEVIGDEFRDCTTKTLRELSDCMNLLRNEFRQFATSVENRVSGIEQRMQLQPSPKEDTLSTQKYYDLIQKVIELENRVSALKSKEQY